MAGKDRSPNYPALGLGAAVDAVRKIWTAERRTVVGADVAAKALGYSPKGVGYTALSGPARTSLSALKKYGLLVEEGNGVRVSDLAIRILHPESPEEQLRALREAALKPEIFRELKDTHYEASDEALTSTLIRRGFSVAGARQFIDAFRDTLAVAKLTGSGYDVTKTTREPEAMTSGLEVRAAETVTPSDSARAAVRPRSYTWALSKDISVELRIVGDPLTKAEADRLRQYVDLTVSALVADSE